MHRPHHPHDLTVTSANPAPILSSEGASLEALAEAAAGCTACELYRDATQAVFGDGPPEARLMLVGEQPGDKEDVEGLPFVGPAGRVLDDALDRAGLDRSDVFLTNTVKHFKWKQGKWRRLHAKPDKGEVSACLPWLEAEAAEVGPELIVGLGATACQAMLGNDVRVTRDRGQTRDWNGRPVLITVHPSSLLRMRDRGDRAAAMEAFVADLRGAAGHLDAV